MSQKSTLATTLKSIRNHLPYIGRLVKQRDHLLTKILEFENKTTDPLISQFVSFQRKQINNPRATLPQLSKSSDHNADKCNLLIYTVVDEKYFPFAILFAMFATLSNPEAKIEVGVSNWELFSQQYHHFLEYFHKKFGDKILFSQIMKTKIFANSLRFLVQPLNRAKYVYITDGDIFLTQDVLSWHLTNIKTNILEFSNIKRQLENKLTGLHFIEYDKMWPLQIPDRFDLSTLIDLNDEELLYLLMQTKSLFLPPPNITFRPTLGLHVSFFSRPPLPTLTTDDDLVTDFPSWFTTVDHKIDYSPARQYLKLRHSVEFLQFTTQIKSTDVMIRKIIQYCDLVCLYAIEKQF